MNESEIKKNIKLSTTQIVKSINSLMGIVTGLVSDGVLNELEVRFLKIWCDENKHIADQYPANIIFRRIHEVLIDDVLTKEERDHLFEELKIMSGNDFANTGSALPEHISSVFDDDPLVIFKSNEFVFTGQFMFGTRNACETAVLNRGGSVKNYITQETNYLVVGTRTSPDWIAENFGRKIQKAAEMASTGEFEISIIREVDWALSLK